MRARRISFVIQKLSVGTRLVSNSLSTIVLFRGGSGRCYDQETMKLPVLNSIKVSSQYPVSLLSRTTPEFLYKILWIHYLIFHTFFSTSSLVIPDFSRWIVLGTGFLALGLHRRDHDHKVFIIHKILFIILNIWPLAIDSRVMTAIFESIVFIVVLFRGGRFTSLREPYRILISLVFFFAAFHKLNSSHLFTSGSCSKFFLSSIGITSTVILTTIPFVAIAGEFILALAFAFSRSQRIPWILLFIFSLSISLSGFHQFVAILWVLAYPLSFQREKEISLRWLPLAALFSLNALAPFLGIKNAGSMNMYSNLVLKNGFTNHYIFPLSIPGNLGDVVRIIRSNNSYIHPGSLLPRKYLQIQIRNSMEHGYETDVTFEEPAGIRTISNHKDRTDFIQELSTLEYFLLNFSSLKEDPGQCHW